MAYIYDILVLESSRYCRLLRPQMANALVKLPNVHPCRRRIIVTFDEEDTITDKHGTIEVIPCWKWFMEIDR